MNNFENSFIDLFSGAGGLSCGLEQAGFFPIIANEINPKYAATYQINHPSTKVMVCDIKNIDEKRLLKEIDRFHSIDLIAGGPPCQGFSINAPKRSVDDPRNNLFKDYLRIVKEIKPKAILIENVPGIFSLDNGSVIEQIYEFLENIGYKVDHKILFAGHYGIPQLRFRTIIIGIYNYHNKIEFPQPQYYANAIANFQNSKELCFSLTPMHEYMLKPKVTVIDAIGDLPEICDSEKKSTYIYEQEPQCAYQKLMRIDSEKITSHFCSKLSEINQKRLKYIPVGGSWRDIPYDLLPKGLQRAKRSDHTKRYGRLDPNDLCSTILTKCDPHWGSFFHPNQPRTISVREAARIQSFPDRYRFIGTMTEQYAQVGNSVPPLMAKAIGSSIKMMINGLDNESRTS